MRLSGAQSPFARSGRYPSRRGFHNLLSRHYSAVFAHTDSRVGPRPSSCLEFNLVHQVFAGCCQPLLGIAPSRRYLRESFPTCLDPYPGCPCGALTRFLPTRHRPSRNLEPVGAAAFATMALIRIAISVRHSLRGCSHSLMFRPVGLLATPIAPTAVSRCSGSSRSPLGFGGCPIAFALARSPTPFVFLEIPATPWAAVTSTSAPISVCYLPEQRIC